MNVKLTQRFLSQNAERVSEENLDATRRRLELAAALYASLVDDHEADHMKRARDLSNILPELLPQDLAAAYRTEYAEFESRLRREIAEAQRWARLRFIIEKVTGKDTSHWSLGYQTRGMEAEGPDRTLLAEIQGLAQGKWRDDPAFAALVKEGRSGPGLEASLRSLAARGGSQTCPARFAGLKSPSNKRR